MTTPEKAIDQSTASVNSDRSEPSNGTTPMKRDVFEALQAPYRRRLLLALLDSNPQSVDDLRALRPGLGGQSQTATGGGRIEL